jgi:hypothetical protein
METLKLMMLSYFELSQCSCKVIEIKRDRLEVFILYVSYFHENF